MVYHLGFGVLVIPLALAALVYQIFWGTDQYDMVIYGFLLGGYHLVVGLLLMKYAVLPLHIRLAIADRPPRSYPLNPLPGTYPTNTPPTTYPVNPLPGRTVYGDKASPE